MIHNDLDVNSNPLPQLNIACLMLFIFVPWLDVNHSLKSDTPSSGVEEVSVVDDDDRLVVDIDIDCLLLIPIGENGETCCKHKNMHSRRFFIMIICTQARLSSRTS